MHLLCLTANGAVRVAIALMLSGNALAALSFNITYIDDANGTFATRGWLELGFAVPAKHSCCGRALGQLNSIPMRRSKCMSTRRRLSQRAGGTFSLGRYLYRERMREKRVGSRSADTDSHRQ